MKLTCFIAALFSLLCAQVASEGGHRHRHRSPNSHCRNCPPGWGVTLPCTKSEQTGCSRCPLGFYSRHHSYKLPCWPCSLCGDGLFVSHRCSSVRDTICDSCQTHYKPLSNDDFRLKCQNPSRNTRSNQVLLGIAKFDSSSGSFSFVLIFCVCITAVCVSFVVYYVVKNFWISKTKYKELRAQQTP